MNNRGLSKAERLHHVLLEARTVHVPRCLDCDAQVHTQPLKKFPGCVGLRCRLCGWEGEPISTLNSEGQLVRADAQGQPTGEVLLDLTPRMGLVEMTPHEAIERAA